MCSFSEQNGNSRDSMCWCFEEISLMILVQRILMYMWYRLLLKMFPRLSVVPSCNEFSTRPRSSFPCGQLADEYWNASHFSRTLTQTVGRCYEKTLQPPFSPIGFCNHKPTEPMYDHIEQEDDDQFKFNRSDISQIYQSTFLEDECFHAEEIPWDSPVPELKQKPVVDDSLLLNDYYIDDDLEDHLYAAEYHTAFGTSLFSDSWID